MLLLLLLLSIITVRPLRASERAIIIRPTKQIPIRSAQSSLHLLVIRYNITVLIRSGNPNGRRVPHHLHSKIDHRTPVQKPHQPRPLPHRVGVGIVRTKELLVGHVDVPHPRTFQPFLHVDLVPDLFLEGVEYAF